MFCEFYIETTVHFIALQAIRFESDSNGLLLYTSKTNEYAMLISNTSEISFWVSEQKQHLESKSVFLCEPGEILKINSSIAQSSDVFLLIFCYKPFPKTDQPSKTSLPLPRKAEINHPQFYGILEEIKSEQEYDVYNYKPRLNILLAQLLLVLCRYCQHKEISQNSETSYSYTIVNKVVDYLRCNYQNNLSSLDIAEHIGLNYDYINTLFKNSIGITIMKYVDSFRINAAKDMLLHSNLQINKIAKRLGFYNPQYFTKKFNTMVGVSPIKFRQREKELED